MGASQPTSAIHFNYFPLLTCNLRRKEAMRFMSLFKILRLGALVIAILFAGLACSSEHQSGSAFLSEESAPEIPPATPPVNPPGPITPTLKLSCEEARFVTLLNIHRRIAQNLNPVTVSRAGVLAARWHAQDMGEKAYMGHTEPNGRDYITRMAEFGFGGWAENAAAGVYTGQEAFCLWKNSPGHNSNMLGAHGSIGIGMNVVGGSPYGAYWSNGFGPTASDLISPPLTDAPNCAMPTALPGC
jgi:uncharacterized protein YkwD